MFLRLLRVAAVVGAVLGLAGSPAPGGTHAAAGPPTPATDCASAGRLLRYVVLFDADIPEQRAAQTIRAACGISIAYYPQIGVAVATSASGVAALLASVRPAARPEELAILLRQQADPLPCPGYDNPDAACTSDTDNGFYGHGLVDALTAVTARPGPAGPGSGSASVDRTER